MKIQPLSADFAVSPQIAAADLAAIAAAGFDFIVNNRPDGEVPGQPSGAAIAAAAQAAGIGYATIPVAGLGPKAADIRQLAELIAAGHHILGFCRSGARSAMLWALAQASRGAPTEALLAATSAAGYDLAMLRPALAKLGQAI